MVQDVVAWTLCCAALVWGGGPERIVAATWLVLFEFATMMHDVLFGETRQLVTIDWYFAGIDVIAGAIWITAALYANRNFVLWVAAMQILAMVAHVSRGLTEAIAPIAYIVMVIAPGWLQLLFLAIGLVRHIRRKRLHGPYRDWRAVPNVPAFLRWLSGPAHALQPQQSAMTPRTWRDDLK